MIHSVVLLDREASLLSIFPGVRIANTECAEQRNSFRDLRPAKTKVRSYLRYEERPPFIARNTMLANTRRIVISLAYSILLFSAATALPLIARIAVF